MKKHILTFIILMTLSFLFAHESDLIYKSQNIADIHITVDQSKLDWIYSHVDSDSLHLSSVHYQNDSLDITMDSVGFRLRGNTSRDAAKKSFKLDINNFVPGRKISGVEKLDLKAEQNDPSLIRSTLAFKLMEEIGLVASRVNYARVYINDDYMGLYEIIEHIDENFVSYHYENNDGNLWKCLWPADLNYRGSAPSNYYPYQDDERPYELKTNIELYDYSELANLIDVINNTPSASMKDSLESVLKVTDFIKYLAVNILTGSWDDYRYLKNNFYLYHDPLSDRFRFIPYDYDNTFGIDWITSGQWGNPDWTRINIYSYASNDNDGRPLSDLIFNTPEYRNLFSHFLQFYTNQVFREDQWTTYGDSIKALIRPDVLTDSYYPRDHGFDINDFDDSYNTNFRYNHMDRGLYEFMRKRRESTNEQINWQSATPSIYRQEMTQVGSRFDISISAFATSGIKKVELISYDSAQNQSAIIPFTRNRIANTTRVELYDQWTLSEELNNGDSFIQILATDSNNVESLWPRHGLKTIEEVSLTNYSLYINELMASNSATIADPAGEYDDWVEIYNSGNEDIDLSGMFLSDKANNLAKWDFPEGSTIDAGDYLIVWCDEDGDKDQAGLHANFKLSASGEFISLVDRDSISIIDGLYFPALDTDISYGREEDAQSDWISFAIPTPGSMNSGTAIDELIPLSSVLHPNYPNPFNPITTISYQVSTVSNIELSIYNAAGKKVRTLIDETKDAGIYRINWNASRMPSGIYLAVMKVGGQIFDTQKMLLVK